MEKHWYSNNSSRFHKRAQYCEQKRETLVANNLIAGIIRNDHRQTPANCTMRSHTEEQARCLTQARTSRPAVAARQGPGSRCLQHTKVVVRTITTL
jgi:hypothetical protein